MNTTIVSFETPKGLVLHGFSHGNLDAERAYLFVHGLGGTVFSQAKLLPLLARSRASVLVFGNRGSGIVSRFKRRIGKGETYASVLGGKAFERFEDCVDDIEGGVRFLLGKGVKKVVLVGHSTGCQKSVYYLSKKPDPRVVGAVLLAPMSDYAFEVFTRGTKDLNKAVRVAQNMIAVGKGSAFLPSAISPHPITPARFLSLYTPESKEEIFTYASGKKPATLRKVRVPLLSLLAEQDEYAERPAEDIKIWFEETLRGTQSATHVVQDAPHNFSGQESVAHALIEAFVRGL